MERCAAFIDAGYLLAAGGRLTLGTSSRSEIRCDVPGLVAGLGAWIEAHGKLPLLRFYWYDGAKSGVPTAAHELIGGLSYVKVRLGRLIQGEQKGVDALIYRDLMTLARERAISRAYLLSGDEDLREGVIAAQDMGVQVILVGIPATQRTNQSAALIREADEHVVHDAAFWTRFFSRPSPTGSTVATASRPTGPADEAAAQTAGRAFAVEWAQTASPDDVRALLDDQPRIPRDVDIQLITRAETTLGPLQEQQQLKRAMRAGFWAAIAEQSAGGPGHLGDADDAREPDA